MPAIYRLIKSALTPLIIVNAAGMLASGFVILSKGLWQVLWLDTLAVFMAPMFFPLLMIPAAMCGGIAKIMVQRRPVLANVMMALSIGWLIFIMAFWAAWSLDGASVLFPMGGWMAKSALAWGCCGAVAPWAVFARGDRDNVFFTGLVVMLQLGCAEVAIVNATHALEFWDRFLIVAGVMAALAGTQAVYEAWFMRKPA